MLIGLAFGTIIANHVQKVAWSGENIAYVPEFFTFMAGTYAVIAGARAGVNYVNIKREEINAITAAGVQPRPTPPVN